MLFSIAKSVGYKMRHHFVNYVSHANTKKCPTSVHSGLLEFALLLCLSRCKSKIKS